MNETKNIQKTYDLYSLFQALLTQPAVTVPTAPGLARFQARLGFLEEEEAAAAQRARLCVKDLEIIQVFTYLIQEALNKKRLFWKKHMFGFGEKKQNKFVSFCCFGFVI